MMEYYYSGTESLWCGNWNHLACRRWKCVVFHPSQSTKVNIGKKQKWCSLWCPWSQVQQDTSGPDNFRILGCLWTQTRRDGTRYAFSSLNLVTRSQWNIGWDISLKTYSWKVQSISLRTVWMFFSEACDRSNPVAIVMNNLKIFRMEINNATPTHTQSNNCVPYGGILGKSPHTQGKIMIESLYEYLTAYNLHIQIREISFICLHRVLALLNWRSAGYISGIGLFNSGLSIVNIASIYLEYRYNVSGNSMWQ